MNIFVFTKYQRLGASSRVRFLKYLEFFDDEFNFELSPLFNDEYLLDLYSGKNKNKLSAFKSYIFRFFTVLSLIFSKKYQVFWIEKELFPYIPLPIELIFMLSSKVVVFDYDDAVFNNYLTSKISFLYEYKFRCIARNSDHIMVGNDYIAKYFERLGARNVTVIPTVVDIECYHKLVKKREKFSKIKIVWIGTPNTQKYLKIIDEAMVMIQNEFDVEFLAIGANCATLNMKCHFEALVWAEDTEVYSLMNSDIGIMPVDDNLFEQGKCGFKLIQYMACGLPTIASPVGANVTISSNSGLLATDTLDWYNSLKQLIIDDKLRRNLGLVGRKKVEKMYSYQVQVKSIETILNSFSS